MAYISGMHSSPCRPGRAAARVGGSGKEDLMSIEELAMITERIARDADRKMMKALRVARFNRERRSEQASERTAVRSC